MDNLGELNGKRPDLVRCLQPVFFRLAGFDLSSASRTRNSMCTFHRHAYLSSKVLRHETNEQRHKNKNIQSHNHRKMERLREVSKKIHIITTAEANWP